MGIVKLAKRLRFLWVPFGFATSLSFCILVLMPPVNDFLFSEDVRESMLFVPNAIPFVLGVSLTLLSALPQLKLEKSERIVIISLSLATSLAGYLILGFYPDYILEADLNFFSLDTPTADGELYPWVLEIFPVAGSIVSASIFLFLNYRFAISGTEIGSDQPEEPIEVRRIRDEFVPHLDPLSGVAAISLAREAHRMRRLSFIALYGVAGVVFLAVLAVVYAGRLTQSDQISAAALLRARQAEAIAEDALRGFLSEQVTILSRIESLRRDIEDPTQTANREENEGKLVDLVVTKDELPAFIDLARKRYVAAASQFDAVLSIAPNAMIGVGDASSSSSLVASAVTRFGLVIVLSFFAQALINLYRYSIRLSSFYWSRAMLVAVSAGDQSQMISLTDVFSPLRIPLGREPSSLVDDTAKLIGAAKGT